MVGRGGPYTGGAKLNHSRLSNKKRRLEMWEHLEHATTLGEWALKKGPRLNLWRKSHADHPKRKAQTWGFCSSSEFFEAVFARAFGHSWTIPSTYRWFKQMVLYINILLGANIPSRLTLLSPWKFVFPVWWDMSFSPGKCSMLQRTMF